MKRIVGLVVVLPLLTLVGSMALGAEALPVTVAVQGVPSFAEMLYLAREPGERVEVSMDIPFDQLMKEIELAPRQRLSLNWNFEISSEVDGGLLEMKGQEKLLWHLPSSAGFYRLQLNLNCGAKPSEQFPTPIKQWTSAASFQAQVPHQLDREQGVVEGFAVGIYPDEKAEDAKIAIMMHREKYKPPQYFYEVTDATEQLFVSPHFQLRDFTLEESWGKRRFIALDRELLERLEQIVDELNSKGRKGEGLKVLRGYLSPLDRQRLGRRGAVISAFSRHLYGDSAVIIVDADGDGKMDDLTRDGKADAADARFLAGIIEALESRTQSYGGLGIYGDTKDPTLPSGPYVQFDLRGWRARWEAVED